MTVLPTNCIPDKLPTTPSQLPALSPFPFMSWRPRRSLSETEAILCAPGSPHEVETRLIDGRLLRVYKHLWPSLRVFWLESVARHCNKTYIVFEGQRLTYQDVHQQALKTASLFQAVYGVTKGDRVGICARNSPEYLFSWWACHLIGAVPVLANAWLPLKPLKFCLVHTMCKLIIVDTERADRLEPVAANISQQTGATGFLVLHSHEGRGSWIGMKCYRAALDSHSSNPTSILDPGITPEDNAVVVFTSGTTGLPKGVLSTQRQFLTNVLNTQAATRRAALRSGELPPSPDEPQAGALVAVPLFHVTGMTSYSMMATFLGMKIILMRKWIPEEAARLIREENVGVAGGVPAMVSDLIDSSLAGHPLKGLFFGGSPAPAMLPQKAKRTFPNATLSQGYGLTETNSIAVGIAGEDYIQRPLSVGLPSPVNEVKVVDDNGLVLPAGQVGEVLLRGPNVMKEYYGDPEATHKAITQDGWLRSGDCGLLDDDGFLFIKDRIKDIILRGGENIDSVSVENALYADPRVLEAAVVGVPDARLGELVVGIVSVKPAFRGRVSEASLMAVARKRLPKFAWPVMIIVRDNSFDLTPSRKIMKNALRQVAHRKWQERLRQGGPEPFANL